MIIERDSDDLYNDEYDVRVRRLTAIAAQTVPTKEGFGAALVRFEPGETIREHSNKPGVEEMFVMLEGTADFMLEGEVLELHEGDVAFAPVGQRHRFTNTGDNTGRMICIWWRPAGFEPPVAADAAS